MIRTVHKAESKGHAYHGWLDTHHTFSFANYNDPERMGFGVLRVLNDDIESSGKGFGTHPHDNMEIISIPLVGDLEHKDSMGNVAVIKEGDVQVMSAGTGIYHSEYNRNTDKDVNFLQIWIIPNKKQVEPRYDQISIKEIEEENLPQLTFSEWKETRFTLHLILQHRRGTVLNFLESAYQAGAKLAGWKIEELRMPPLEEI